jgi:hypothetical protein
MYHSTMDIYYTNIFLFLYIKNEIFHSCHGFFKYFYINELQFTFLNAQLTNIHRTEVINTYTCIYKS